MTVTTPAVVTRRDRPMTSSHPAPAPCHWFFRLAAVLDPRCAPRLPPPLPRAAPPPRPPPPRRRANDAVPPLAAGAGRLMLAIDDTPTQRYGPCVEGAGVHHNPAPGPAGAAFVYGHVWVVLGLLAAHPPWGTTALPLLARLYVRRKDLPAVPKAHRPPFLTKLELAVGLIRWALTWLGHWGKPLWAVADGAYAQAALLKPMW